MNKFLDYDITEHETIVLMNVVQGMGGIPSKEDILHELIRLAEIGMKHEITERRCLDEIIYRKIGV